MTFFLTTTRLKFDGWESQQRLMKKAANIFGVEMAGRIDIVLPFQSYVDTEIDVFIDMTKRWVCEYVEREEPIVKEVVFEDKSVDSFMKEMYDPIMGLRSIRKAGLMVRSAIKSSYVDGQCDPKNSIVSVRVDVDGDVLVETIAVRANEAAA